MKKIKSIILIIFIAIIGILTLTGCTKDNKKETDPKNSKVSSKNENEIKEVIKADVEKENLGMTEAGDYVIKLKNKSNFEAYIQGVTVNFFDADGNFTTKEEAVDSFFCIPANSEIITYIYGYDENFDKYSKSEIEVMLDEEPLYKYYTENLEIKTNETEDEIAMTITNNNKEDLDCITLNVAFFEEEKVVGMESEIIYDKTISANGGKAYMTIDYPIDKEYEKVSFDKFKVYVTAAYKDI